MIISDLVFNRMKSLGVSNGVFLMVSNDRNQLVEFAQSFARRLLDYRLEDVALNEKVFSTDADYISADMVNDFIAFESKKSVGVPAKILIMHDVDLLKDSVSDKMLKCIEDYNEDSLIILTTTSLEKVSRTIKSRCMVFKEWLVTEDSFVTNRDTYLSFIDQIDQVSYSDLDKLIGELPGLGIMNVIQAIFTNCDDSQSLAIGSHALDAHLTGSNDEQVAGYLVNSFWCLKKHLRTWEDE